MARVVALRRVCRDFRPCGVGPRVGATVPRPAAVPVDALVDGAAGRAARVSAVASSRHDEHVSGQHFFPGETMLKMIRLPALLAAVCLAAATALAQPANPPAPPAPLPHRRRTGGGCRGERPGSGSGRQEGDGSRREPVRPRGAVARRRLGCQGHADHPGHHVDGQLVHHRRQGVRAVQAGRAGARREQDLLGRAVGAPGHRRAQGIQSVPLHRRVGSRGDQQAHGSPRQRRPQHLDLDVDPARDRERAEPPAGRSRLPRHRRLHRPVRRDCSAPSGASTTR